MRSIESDPRVETGSLQICGRCQAIRGKVPDRDDGAEQLCRCAPIEVRQAVLVWGGDHNTYAELCRCCGLVLLPSGSRWSVWFCQTCKPNVTALNRAAGRCLIPIGRHSIMNGVGAPLHQLERQADIERFVDDMQGLFARIGGLEERSLEVVARNLTVLGFKRGNHVYLGEYLSRARRSKLTPQDGFAALVLETLVPTQWRVVTSIQAASGPAGGEAAASEEGGAVGSASALHPLATAGASGCHRDRLTEL